LRKFASLYYIKNYRPLENQSLLILNRVTEKVTERLFLEEKDMGDRKFYLFKRKSGFYYAELLNQKGTKTIFKSTGSKNRDEALLIVAGWLRDGVPVRDRKPIKNAADFHSVMKYLKTGSFNEEQALGIVKELKKRGLVTIGVTPATQGNQKFIEFLFNFYDPEKSMFLKDRAAHGRSITKRYCAEAKRVIKQNWQPYFGEILLSDISRQSLKEFGLHLSEQGLTGGTINNRLLVGSQPLRWAFLEKLIPENVAEKLGGFKGGEKKRDILSREEFKALFSMKWDDKRAYAGALLAATSGLRIGEVQAVRKIDIGEGILHVRSNWNSVDGLKLPKNGKPRTVYLLPEVKTLLDDLITDSPWAEMENPFVFYSDNNSQRPCYDAFFRNQLYTAMAAAGVSREGRKLDFHSLRHGAGTFLLDATGDLRKTGKILGHLGIGMTEMYGDHETKETIAEMGNAASNILNFSRGA